MDKLLFGPQLDKKREDEITERVKRETKLMAVNTVETDKKYSVNDYEMSFVALKFNDKTLFANSKGSLINRDEIDISRSDRGIVCSSTVNPQPTIYLKNGDPMWIDNKMFKERRDCELHISRIREILFPAKK